MFLHLIKWLTISIVNTSFLSIINFSINFQHLTSLTFWWTRISRHLSKDKHGFDWFISQLGLHLPLDVSPATRVWIRAYLIPNNWLISQISHPLRSRENKFWHLIGADWHQIEKIWNFLRSVFCSFWLTESQVCLFWFQSGAIGGQIWHPWYSLIFDLTLHVTWQTNWTLQFRTILVLNMNCSHTFTHSKH